MSDQDRTTGRCGDTLTTGTITIAPRTVCALPFGHQGWHRADNGAEWSCGSVTTIPTERLRALFDMAVGSLNFSSGWLDSDEVEHLRGTAVLLGVDPLKGTPSEFVAQYPHPFKVWRGWTVGKPLRGCQETRCGKPPADPIHHSGCDQCRGKGWVRVEGKVTGAACGYETATECQACNPDGRIPYAGQIEFHDVQPHHLAHQTPPGVVDPNCPACKEATR